MVKWAICTTALMTSIWWCVAEGASAAWAAGIAAILLATAASLSVDAGPSWHLRFGGCARFVPYFLWQSIRGSLDVSRRALDPRRPLAPTVITYPMRLQAGFPQICFANAVSLLPGTLSARMLDNDLTVHALDGAQSIAGGLRELEDRIGAMFGERFAAEAVND